MSDSLAISEQKIGSGPDYPITEAMIEQKLGKKVVGKKSKKKKSKKKNVGKDTDKMIEDVKNIGKNKSKQTISKPMVKSKVEVKESKVEFGTVKGRCIIHAYYSNGKESVSSGPKHKDQESKDQKFDKIGLVLDFDNHDAGQKKVAKCFGYIRNCMRKTYVITCNHVATRSVVKYVGFCKDRTGEITRLDMEEVGRIPGLDPLILRVTKINYEELPDNEIETRLDQLDDPPLFSKSYDVIEENYIATSTILLGRTKNSKKGSRKKGGNNKKSKKAKKDVKVKDGDELRIDDGNITIDEKIELQYMIFKSDIISQIPMFAAPINNLSCLKGIIKNHKIDIKRDLQPDNPKGFKALSLISETIDGLMGTIMMSGTQPIGMVVACIADEGHDMMIASIPLLIINKLVDNYIRKHHRTLSGIQISSDIIEIDNELGKMKAHYLRKNSCPYVNGKKEFTFMKRDIITEVDGKKLDKDGNIMANDIGVCVPINTYTMIKSIFGDIKPITFTISRKTGKKLVTKTYNIDPIPYDNMYKLPITNYDMCGYKGMIFVEVSEELIEFYRTVGIEVNNPVKDMYECAVTNERCVILLNYKREINKKYLSADEYAMLPVNGNDTRYFYIVQKINGKKISGLNDVRKSIEGHHGKQKITLHGPDDESKIIEV